MKVTFPIVLHWDIVVGSVQASHPNRRQLAAGAKSQLITAPVSTHEPVQITCIPITGLPRNALSDLGFVTGRSRWSFGRPPFSSSKCVSNFPQRSLICSSIPGVSCCITISPLCEMQINPPSPTFNRREILSVTDNAQRAIRVVHLGHHVGTATALRMNSSPIPVQETAQAPLAANVPAPTIGESPTRPGNFLAVPPVLVPAARLPRESSTTQPTVPMEGESSGTRISSWTCTREIVGRHKRHLLLSRECVGARSCQQHMLGLRHHQSCQRDRNHDGGDCRDMRTGSVLAIHDRRVQFDTVAFDHGSCPAGIKTRVVLQNVIYGSTASIDVPRGRPPRCRLFRMLVRDLVAVPHVSDRPISPSSHRHHGMAIAHRARFDCL